MTTKQCNNNPYRRYCCVYGCKNNTKKESEISFFNVPKEIERMTTYSISLDDVDLALLPVRSLRYNDFLKKEYYEFQVMTTEAKEDDSPINEHYKCHICAIDVPSAFSNAHCAGAKHQANVRIATVASQRLRELLTATHPIATPRPAQGFCDPCATIAGKDHDKTKEHRVAVIHDRMLCELTKLYIGEDDDLWNENGSENIQDYNSKHIKRDDNKAVAKDTTPAKPQGVINANNQIQKVAKEGIDNAKVNGEANEPEDAQYVKIPMNMYIKILKTVPIVPKIAVKAVAGNVQITVDKDKMLVSSDHFHSFYREESQIMCNLCMRLLKPGEEQIHKLTVAHMESIMQVVEDSHCIREVNENWSHCILCNSIIKKIKVEAHKGMKKHNDKRRDAIEIQFSTDAETSNVKSHEVINFKPETDKLQCSGIVPAPLNKKVSASTENVTSRNVDIPKIDQIILAPNKKISQKMDVKNADTKAEKKTKNASDVSSNNAVDTQNSVMNPIQIRSEMMPVFLDANRIEYPFEVIDQSSVRCIICCCVVPRTLNHGIDHLNGQRHANSLKKQFPPL